jgi:hypothetical protein
MHIYMYTCDQLIVYETIFVFVYKVMMQAHTTGAALIATLSKVEAEALLEKVRSSKVCDSL